MPITNPYEILGIQPSASREEIKRAYKEIALSCHPDKLTKLTDDNEKNKRIEKFKSATHAYNLLNNKSTSGGDGFQDAFADFADYDDDSYDIFKNIWSSLFDDDVSVKDILLDVAKEFIKSKIYPKSYYNPSDHNEACQNTDTDSTEGSSESSGCSGCSDIESTSSSSADSTTECTDATTSIIHNVTLEVTYAEILHNTKKKVRLLLLNINEPIFFDIYVREHPRVVKEYMDSDNILHEIVINIGIKKDPNSDYDHIILKSGPIDLVKPLEISIKDYLLGCIKEITYVDNSTLQVTIPAFQKEYYEIAQKGLLQGSLILHLSIKPVKEDEWDKLSKKDKVELIRILDTLQK
jgi:curved DNA-binding protein CbpA